MHGVLNDQSMGVKQVVWGKGLLLPIPRSERKKGLSSCDLVLPRLNCVPNLENKRQLGRPRPPWLGKGYSPTDVLSVILTP